MRALNQIWRGKDIQPSLLEIGLGGTTAVLRECSGEVLHSAALVGSSSDTRVIIVVLETNEAPENGHIGTGASPLQKSGGINSPAEVHVHQCLLHSQ